ncbi:HNH endonuclease [Polyangium mundeleinium]|uniref:HNH endonuclease n=1 Tax=Polyangium mundeleinium TaxID=2995306 RepID=UPI00358DC35D
MDERERKERLVAIRRGQPEFRARVVRRYRGRCIFSGCDVEDALEAAHIIPYRNDESDSEENGLLLRADLHTLFDLGLFAVDTSTWTVLVSKRLKGAHYDFLNGYQLEAFRSGEMRPSRRSLDYHRRHIFVESPP